eukprot:1159338-Pelagomonas_calceolata.AAC.12
MHPNKRTLHAHTAGHIHTHIHTDFCSAQAQLRAQGKPLQSQSIQQVRGQRRMYAFKPAPLPVRWSD